MKLIFLLSATEKDLHIYLDSEGAFEEKKACEIIFQILKAIEFLHSKNVLHLDIKVRLNRDFCFLEIRFYFILEFLARKCPLNESDQSEISTE